MNELLREIEDDIRREKFDRLWYHFGRIMVAISLGIVLVTIVVVMVQNYRQSQAMEQTGQFIAGVNRFDIGDYKDAIPVFTKLADGGSSRYYGLAMLRLAQAQAASGDKDAAAQTYKKLGEHDEAFSELAKMQDTGQIIQPDKKSPFYYTQSEWRGWQLVNAGKKDEALAQFAALRDDSDAPFSMRQRMQEVMQQLSPDADVKDKK